MYAIDLFWIFDEVDNLFTPLALIDAYFVFFVCRHWLFLTFFTNNCFTLAYHQNQLVCMTFCCVSLSHLCLSKNCPSNVFCLSVKFSIISLSFQFCFHFHLFLIDISSYIFKCFLLQILFFFIYLLCIFAYVIRICCYHQ